MYIIIDTNNMVFSSDGGCHLHKEVLLGMRELQRSFMVKLCDLCVTFTAAS